MNTTSAFAVPSLVIFLLVGCGTEHVAILEDRPMAPAPAPATPEPLAAAGVPVSVCPGRTDNVVVLTFDDGPSPYTDKLLELLDKSHARATFFLKADNLDETHPQHVENRLRVRRMQAAGHEICNHTHSHRRLTSLDDAAVRDEITKAEDLIANETGRRTRCMRPPYTDYDNRVLGILGQLDYRVILWSFDTADWHHASTEFPDEFDPNKVLDTVTAATGSLTGPLIHIQHDNEYTEASVDLVPLVIDRLRTGGWEVVSLSECIGGWIDKPLQ